MTEQCWTPSPKRVASAQSTNFISHINQNYRQSIADFHQLYQWSITHNKAFWSATWDFCDIIGDKGERIIKQAPHFHQCRFFPDARLNFAEQFLKRRDHETALTFWGEDKVNSKLTYHELYQQVAKVRQFLIDAGVKPGDRVAGILPNKPEAIIIMLATTALGAIWTSTSPDFGKQGIIDRFGQVDPKILFVVDGYYYHGKTFNCRQKFQSVITALPGLITTVVIDYIGDDAPLTSSNSITYRHILAHYQACDMRFERFAFDHPVYILFSSGTTGVPKCIVHGSGGVILQHLKELKLHTDVKAAERLFYFTTCGWMMWNWLASGLAAGAVLNLYDGSPFVNAGNILFDYIETEKIDHFGVSAKYIDALHKADLSPKDSHDLSSLRSVLSTGSPLSGQSFDYVYEHISNDVCLSSISGGTDIVSCFALGSPTLPVYRGELQTRGLGLAVEAFDDNQTAIRNQKGELVCTQPFPCMPVYFLNDTNDEKFLATYFSRFSNIWHHGDFIEITQHDGLIFHGRSDSVLNPSGVRIGTAEIYRQVDKVDAVIDSVVIGQQYDGDIRIVLFVQLRPGLILDDDLKTTIKKTIRDHTTPRHVPAIIASVTDIPKTKSGKTVEIAVRDTVHGQRIHNKNALANPEALAQFANRPELA